MGFFSLNWFKSEKQKEKEQQEEQQKKKQQELSQEQLNKIFSSFTETFQLSNSKPYRSIKLVNDKLTVVLLNGSIVNKSSATEDDFNKIRNATTEDEIFKICSSPETIEEHRRLKQEQLKAQALREGLKVLEGLEDFEVEDDNKVYFKGVPRTLPPLLVEELLQVIERHKNWGFSGNGPSLNAYLNQQDDYLALKRFFMWCCLNPRAEVADRLYDFLKKNSFRITKQGFFVALRNVVTVSTSDTKLVQFVSNTYNKIKAVWKKLPRDYNVFELENGSYSLVRNDQDFNGKLLGNLEELYLDLPNMTENRFTDDWTKTFDIRIGRVVDMPLEDCSWSTADCAHAGLHFTSDQIHYVGCGDQSVLVLINPMKVVGIGEHKGRCHEYLPIMTVPREEATEILHDLDFDTLALDEEFAIRELQNLANKVKEGFSKEAIKYEFNIPVISSDVINQIVKSLEEMKSSLKGRVVEFD